MAKKKSKREGRKKGKQLSDKDLTKHHLDPVSRDGSNDEKNIKYCPPKIHQAFNTLFADFYLEDDEIILILQTFGKDRFIKYRYRKDKKRKSKAGFNRIWKTLFVIALKPDEIILFLKTFGQNRFLEPRKHKDVEKLKQAWKTLDFDNKTDEELIEIIKNEWSPKDITTYSPY